MVKDPLYIISVFSAMFPLLTAVTYFPALNINSKILMLLFVFAFFAQFHGWMNAADRWRGFNIYCISDAAIWSYIFIRTTNNKWTRVSIMVVFSLQFLLFYSFLKQSGLTSRFFHESVCLNSLVQVFWVLIFFFERYKSEVFYSLEKDPMFWFCLGLLVYCPSTYFLFAYYQVVNAKDPGFADLWDMHSLVNIFMYVLFSIGMYVNTKRTLNA